MDAGASLGMVRLPLVGGKCSLVVDSGPGCARGSAAAGVLGTCAVEPQVRCAAGRGAAHTWQKPEVCTAARTGESVAPLGARRELATLWLRHRRTQGPAWHSRSIPPVCHAALCYPPR